MEESAVASGALFHHQFQKSAERQDMCPASMIFQCVLRTQWSKLFIWLDGSMHYIHSLSISGTMDSLPIRVPDYFSDSQGKGTETRGGLDKGRQG